MGAGIVEQFANSPDVNSFGIMTGTSSGVAFPDRPALLVRFQADPDNVAPVFLGSSAATCIWQMAAGTETGWIAANNLNQFFQRAASGTMDYIQWWVQR